MKVFDICDSWHIFQSWCEDLSSICLLTGSNGKANLYNEMKFVHTSLYPGPQNTLQSSEKEKNLKFISCFGISIPFLTIFLCSLICCLAL